MDLNLSKNVTSDIMKNSKNTELSSTIYPKIVTSEQSPEKLPKSPEDNFEFRVANSVEDID